MPCPNYSTNSSYHHAVFVFCFLFFLFFNPLKSSCALTIVLNVRPFTESGYPSRGHQASAAPQCDVESRGLPVPCWNVECLGLVWASTAAWSSWVQRSYKVENTPFHAGPPWSLALTTVLPPLSQWFVLLWASTPLAFSIVRSVVSSCISFSQSTAQWNFPSGVWELY